MDIRDEIHMGRYLGVQKITFPKISSGGHTPQGGYRLVTTITVGGGTGLPLWQGLRALALH